MNAIQCLILFALTLSSISHATEVILTVRLYPDDDPQAINGEIPIGYVYYALSPFNPLHPASQNSNIQMDITLSPELLPDCTCLCHLLSNRQFPIERLATSTLRKLYKEPARTTCKKVRLVSWYSGLSRIQQPRVELSQQGCGTAQLDFDNDVLPDCELLSSTDSFGSQSTLSGSSTDPNTGEVIEDEGATPKCLPSPPVDLVALLRQWAFSRQNPPPSTHLPPVFHPFIALKRVFRITGKPISVQYDCTDQVRQKYGKPLKGLPYPTNNQFITYHIELEPICCSQNGKKPKSIRSSIRFYDPGNGEIILIYVNIPSQKIDFVMAPACQRMKNGGFDLPALCPPPPKPPPAPPPSPVKKTGMGATAFPAWLQLNPIPEEMAQLPIEELSSQFSKLGTLQ